MPTKPKTRAISLVTGATSALGREVIKRLMDRGDEVRVIIRDQPGQNPEWKVLPAGVKPYVADISIPSEQNNKVLKEACAGVNTVFHLAAFSRGGRDKFSKFVEVNVVGTETILRACTDANPGDSRIHFIYSSSTSVYGYDRKGEVLTEDSKTAPKNAYGESKLMAEHVIRAFAAANKRVKYTILRIGIIYGEGYNRSFNKVFNMISDGRMRMIGKGDNHLCMVHVNDVVDAMILSSEDDASHNKTYNVTDGVKYTQKGLIEMASKFLGAKGDAKSISKFMVKIATLGKNLDESEFHFLLSDRIVSIDKIREELKFRPRMKIEIEGKDMVAAFQKDRRPYAKIEE